MEGLGYAPAPPIFIKIQNKTIKTYIVYEV